MKKVYLEFVRELLKINFWLFLFKSIWYNYVKNGLAKQNLAENLGAVILPNASIRNAEFIYLGKNVYINEACFLWAGKSGKIIIKDNTLLGPNVMIFSSNHGITKNDLIVNQEWIEKNVIIEEDCWIGAQSIILPGVTIRKGTVVAAGTVVTKDTPEYSIIAGCPGKVISNRQ